GGERDHGGQAQDAAGGGGAISPRVVPDDVGQGPASQLHRAEGPAVSGSAAPMTIREALARLIDRHDLTAPQMAEVVGEIMDGQATPAQIGGLLVALRMKGETVDEIVGAARAMRARMLGVAGDPMVPM